MLKTIEKRICPECSKPAYSSSFSHDWNCPNCGKGVSASETKEEIPKKPNCGEVEECSLYEHCEGCPANDLKIVFTFICPANEDEGGDQDAK